MAPDTIYGRERELVAIASFAEGAGDGPAALTIEGEAGIGKTTLWNEAVDIARRRGPVLATRASGSETALAFAVLSDLLEPVYEELAPQLPAPQQRALSVALLKEDARGASPDQRAVGLGALTALRLLATDRRVTIAVDDVQWVDAASGRTLAFALKRLGGMPVNVITARRLAVGSLDPLHIDGSFLGRVERLELGPLDPSVFGQLLRSTVWPEIPRTMVRRIHEATRGNPFFALEVGRTLTHGRRRSAPTEPLPIPDDVHELLRDRLGTLSPEAREALLVVASATDPDRALVEAVLGTSLGLDEAEATGIIERGDAGLTFSHPLLASAVYSETSPATRREVHRRLAAVATDEEARARHLALSITGPNPLVADALERAAEGARARGAPQTAAELFELSRTATSKQDSEGLRRRGLMVAGNLFDAGDARGARRVAEETLAPLAAGRARADSLFMLSILHWNDARRIDGLLRQALAEVGTDVHLRARILADLGWAAFDLGDLPRAEDSARQALGLAETLEDPFPVRLSLTVLATTSFVAGRADDTMWERAMSSQGALVHAEETTPAIARAMAATWAADVDAARTLLNSEAERLRAQGHEAACWETSLWLAQAAIRVGDPVEATRLVDEAFEIAEDAGLEDVFDLLLAARGLIRAVTGDVDGARADTAASLRMAETFGSVMRTIECRAINGFLELSLDDAEAAHAWLAPAIEQANSAGVVEPGFSWFLWDDIAALITLGRPDEAEALTGELEERGRRLHRPLALATAVRYRGAIAGARGDPVAALEHLQHAVGLHASVANPFELGRTLLVMGEVQRRMKQKRTARESLQRAATLFERTGARLWRDKATRELSRIGGRAPSPDALTPTEEQIARLVAEGRTNREVAGALYVSVSTVETNLKRIYRKLQVRSRTELARKL